MPDLLYFNSANLSITPPEIREAMARYTDEFEQNPSVGLLRAPEGIWESQVSLARFLHARPEDLFLRHNVTSVLNAFVLGIPLPPKSEILVGEFEYGAITNICRLRAERGGLSLRVLKLPGTPAAFRTLTRPQLLESLLSQIGPQTRLVLLSHVVAGIGFELPVRELAQALRARNIFLVVDGAYAPGAISVDLEALDLDFYGCSLYKWMLGPKGTAFGWVSKRGQDVLRCVEAGWNTFEPAGPFAEFGAGSAFQRQFALSGCHDFAPFFAIRDTVALWARLDPDSIRARMRSLRDRLHGKFRDSLGWLSIFGSAEHWRGPLVPFLSPLPDEVWSQARIQANLCRIRGMNYVVFSPHFYNTEAEVDELVARVGQAISEGRFPTS